MINTLDMVRDLEAVGFPRAQAEAQISVMMGAFNKMVKVARDAQAKAQLDLAQSKFDNAELQLAITNLRNDLAEEQGRVKALIRKLG